MTYIPPKNQSAKNISLGLTLIGVALMGIGSSMRYGVVMQVVSIPLIVLGLQLMVRFVLSDFRYIINDLDHGTSELIIYKKQGKNDVKVCHTPLSGVVEIYPYKSKKVDSNTRFNYAQNLTDTAQVVLVADGDKLIEIIIEPDEIFLAELKKRAGHGEVGNAFVM